jgi:hypothetical protein
LRNFKSPFNKKQKTKTLPEIRCNTSQLKAVSLNGNKKEMQVYTLEESGTPKMDREHTTETLERSKEVLSGCRIR